MHFLKYYRYILPQLLLCSVAGLFCIPPLSLPPAHTTESLGNIHQATAIFYDTSHRPSLELQIENAKIFDKNTIDAHNITAHFFTATPLSLHARTAYVTPSKTIIFLDTTAQQSSTHCTKHISTSHMYYLPSSPPFLYTDKRVDIRTGKTHISMMGITIPLKEKKVYFGADLTGYVDPEDSCSLEMSA